MGAIASLLDWKLGTLVGLKASIRFKDSLFRCLLVKCDFIDLVSLGEERSGSGSLQ